MVANIRETSSTRVARSVITIANLAESFDSQVGIHPEKRHLIQENLMRRISDNCDSPIEIKILEVSQWIQEDYF